MIINTISKFFIDIIFDVDIARDHFEQSLHFLQFVNALIDVVQSNALLNFSTILDLVEERKSLWLLVKGVKACSYLAFFIKHLRYIQLSLINKLLQFLVIRIEHLHIILHNIYAKLHIVVVSAPYQVGEMQVLTWFALVKETLVAIVRYLDLQTRAHHY